MVNLILYVYPERGYLRGTLQFILMESTHEQTESRVLDIIFVRNTLTDVQRELRFNILKPPLMYRKLQ